MATQTDWDNYATTIAGHWVLCANCTVPLTGKKLFRQYNLNRYILGLAAVDAPIDPTEYQTTVPIGLQMFGGGFGSPIVIQMDWAPYLLLGNVIAIVGQALFNPIYHLVTADNAAFLSSGSAFDFAVLMGSYAWPAGWPGVYSTASLPTCWTTDNGAPGTKSTINIQWTP